MPPDDSDPVFITGASGFIASQIASRLLDQGRKIRVLSRRPVPHLEKRGGEAIIGSLDATASLARGCAGASAVFHTAARVGVWGPEKEFFQVNVMGTRQVLDAARTAGVPRFIYTSSPSVVYTGGNLSGVNESAPLCTTAPSPYPTTKAIAEREVLAANAPWFSTIALRPHLVIGPGDRHLIPRVLSQARKGKLKIIGTGRNRVDITHIDNVVDAHLLAEQSLSTSANPKTADRAYFITNGEPVVFWDWVNELLRGVSLREVKNRISLGAATIVGGFMESVWRTFRFSTEPPITRFIAKELSTDHWFDISAARRDLGYTPRVSMAEATAQLIAENR